MKTHSKFYGLNDSIEPKMIDLITYFDNHGKETVYYGSDEAPTSLIYSIQQFYYFGPKTNTD